MLEIKRLNTSTAALRSEMNKYEEQLEDCRKYKDFMDSITPAGEEEEQRGKIFYVKKVSVGWNSSLIGA